MNLFYYIKKGFQIVFLNREIIRNISKDRNSTIAGTIILSILLILMQTYTSFKNQQNIIQFLFELIFIGFITTFLGLVSIHLLARLFGSKESFLNFYRVYCLSGIILILFMPVIIPFQKFIPTPIEQFIKGIYSIAIIILFLIMFYVIIKETYKLEGPKSIALIVLSFLAFLIIMAIFQVLEISFGVITLEEYVKASNVTTYY